MVIGAGLGGLCAAALLARRGMDVLVLEAHSIPGGAAHAWERDGYTFESGPSLYSGMSDRPSDNPIGQVLHALEEELPCEKYNTWMVHMPEDDESAMGSFLTSIGDDGASFKEALRKYRGERAVREWEALLSIMSPLAAASGAVPAMAVREDFGNLLTIGRCLLKNWRALDLDAVRSLAKPFADVMDDVITDPFLKNWMDMLCFLLSGRKADGTLAAEIGFMFGEWYKPSACLEFPKGGSGAIVDALVRGLKKNGGALRLGAEVEEIITDGGGRATGVRMRRGGAIVRARRAVVSNASIWDTGRMLTDEVDKERLASTTGQTRRCESFVHLHLGIDATGLPEDLQMHHIFVKDWELGVDSPQNLCLVSIPSVIDPTLSPPGKHVIHAYTPGTEPYEIWEHLDRSSDEYKALKRARSEILFEAVEKAIPDVRDRIEIEMIGTPLTHKRFLRRCDGTYGGYGWVGGSSTAVAPSSGTGIDGLLCVGDSMFPGPGVPAVAAGGAILANSLSPVMEHYALLEKVL